MHGAFAKYGEAWINAAPPGSIVLEKTCGFSCGGFRHTFVIHLLESGTDIRYIQDLLGHANLRTTEHYIYVARRQVLKIQSLLDNMDEET
jgi:integrase